MADKNMLPQKLIAISKINSAKPKKCEAPWRTYRNVCFLFSDNNHQKFEDAQAICYKKGGFLASIRSSQEQGFLIKTIQGMGSSLARVRWLIGLYQYDRRTIKLIVGWMVVFPVFETGCQLNPTLFMKDVPYWMVAMAINGEMKFAATESYLSAEKILKKGSMNCFKGQPPNPSLEKKDISVTECLEHCRGLGYTLAGTIPDKCFCLKANNLNNMEVAPRLECNGNCQNQHCGNNNFVTIYNLTFYSDTAESCEDLSQLGLSNPSTYVTKSGEEEKLQSCFTDGIIKIKKHNGALAEEYHDNSLLINKSPENQVYSEN
ncbi:layilin [Trichonephila clavata]|uniref:Layilin n=1 Tax=Trichonephila clavata TaxID=2740835 RepID=A0A8X6HP99_TRICU|nr:layilin [Trichonephila clavata]